MIIPIEMPKPCDLGWALKRKKYTHTLKYFLITHFKNCACHCMMLEGSGSATRDMTYVDTKSALMYET